MRRIRTSCSLLTVVGAAPSAESFYPEGPKKSESFSRIVSSAHAERIKRLLDETKGTVVFGGDTDVSQRYIAPTVVRDVRPDDVLMGE